MKGGDGEASETGSFGTACRVARRGQGTRPRVRWNAGAHPGSRIRAVSSRSSAGSTERLWASARWTPGMDTALAVRAHGLAGLRRANRRWPSTSCVRRCAGLSVPSASKSRAVVAAVIRAPPLPLSRSCREALSTMPSRGSVLSTTARLSSHEPSTGSCAPSLLPDEPGAASPTRLRSTPLPSKDSRSHGRGQPTCPYLPSCSNRRQHMSRQPIRY
jgi:hypothetical protein